MPFKGKRSRKGAKPQRKECESENDATIHRPRSESQYAKPRSGSTTKPGVAQRTPGHDHQTRRNPNGVQQHPVSCCRTMCNPVGVDSTRRLHSRGALRDPGLCCKTPSAWTGRRPRSGPTAQPGVAQRPPRTGMSIAHRTPTGVQH